MKSIYFLWGQIYPTSENIHPNSHFMLLQIVLN